MYELWTIHKGVKELVDQFRNSMDAEARAIEESGLHKGQVYFVSRQGFGQTLYLALNGQVMSEWTEAVRRLTVPVEPEAQNRMPIPPVISRPRPQSRRLPTERKEDEHETKNKAGKPDEQKSFKAVILAVDETAGIVDAIVNVFGIVDDGEDMVHSGSFTKTLAENSHRVKVLDSHNNRSGLSIVGMPLEMREVGRDELPKRILDEYPTATGGLFTKTQYLLDTKEGEGIFKRIKAGAITEYSIGFDALDSKLERTLMPDGSMKIVRHIYQIRLWEYSPVIWGMNPATATTNVKADQDPDPETQDEYTPEGPRRRLGECLVADMSEAMVFILGRQLRDGMISSEEYSDMFTICNDHVKMIYMELPQDIVMRALPEPEMYFFSGNGPDDQKVGRVLSEKNFSKITQASELLEEVLSGSGLQEETEVEMTSTGPQEVAETPTPPEGAGSSSDEAPEDRKKRLLEMFQQRLAELEG